MGNAAQSNKGKLARRGLKFGFASKNVSKVVKFTATDCDGGRFLHLFAASSYIRFHGPLFDKFRLPQSAMAPSAGATAEAFSLSLDFFILI